MKITSHLNNSISLSVQLTSVIVKGDFILTFIISDFSGFVENASILINGVTLTTDGSGEASITLNNATYVYTVSKSGYDDVTGSVTGTGEAVPESVTIAETTYLLNLFVMTVDSNAIEGASIAINGETLTTDVDGHAQINLKNGTYQYTITKADYIDVSDSVTINNIGKTLFKQMSIAALFGEDYRFEFDGTILKSLFGTKTIPITDLGSSTSTYLAGDAKVDLSAFGITYDKSYFFGNSSGKSENWDYPFTYFNAANTTEWLVSELNFRLIETQSLTTLSKLYAKLIYEDEVLQGLSELFIYDASQVDATAVKSYIGIIEDGYGNNVILDPTFDLLEDWTFSDGATGSAVDGVVTLDNLAVNWTGFTFYQGIDVLQIATDKILFQVFVNELDPVYDLRVTVQQRSLDNDFMSFEIREVLSLGLNTFEVNVSDFQRGTVGFFSLGVPNHFKISNPVLRQYYTNYYEGEVTV